jgi:hypothetical protein
VGYTGGRGYAQVGKEHIPVWGGDWKESRWGGGIQVGEEYRGGGREGIQVRG